MIHSELCSACGGPLQLGVGLVIVFCHLSGINTKDMQILPQENLTGSWFYSILYNCKHTKLVKAR